ncbi:ATP-binding cassette domain-containing protein [Nocardioides bigeumensis]|uniref:ABC transporter domain-containing protein n=1 Tax=Nocardioides bigeumensis TaxID=433657 RepID=A0ABP5KGJ7_9ACTN
MQQRDERHTTTPGPALRAVGLSKQADRRPVLCDIDITVVGGEVHGVAGEHRAGSMLVRLLTGAEQADTGRIEVAGVALDPADPEQAQRAGVWAVAEQTHLAPEQTVEAVLGAGSGPGRLVETSRRSRDAGAFLRGLGVGHLEPGSPVGLLSRGDQRLVEVARAAYQRAVVVVLDHPETGLEEREVDLLHQVLGRLVARGTALLYVTSSARDVFDICDSLTLLVPERAGGAASVHLDRLVPPREDTVASWPAAAFVRSGSA